MWWSSRSKIFKGQNLEKNSKKIAIKHPMANIIQNIFVYNKKSKIKVKRKKNGIKNTSNNLKRSHKKYSKK